MKMIIRAHWLATAGYSKLKRLTKLDIIPSSQEETACNELHFLSDCLPDGISMNQIILTGIGDQLVIGRIPAASKFNSQITFQFGECLSYQKLIYNYMRSLYSSTPYSPVLIDSIIDSFSVSCKMDRPLFVSCPD